MRFLKIYRKAKDVFVKPELKWYFGTWKREPNLPIWRRGGSISLVKFIAWNPNKGKAYYPKNSQHVFEGYADGFGDVPVKKYGLSIHKLPGKLTPYTPVWHRDIRKKLRKWHLSWISPIIRFPIWTAFRFMDNDIMWKTKYGDYRYEFPAHITLVIFGLAISVTAHIPENREDDYWESLLTYLELKDLKETNKTLGSWHSFDTDNTYFAFNPNFLKEPYKSELIKIQNEVQNQKGY